MLEKYGEELKMLFNQKKKETESDISERRDACLSQKSEESSSNMVLLNQASSSFYGKYLSGKETFLSMNSDKKQLIEKISVLKNDLKIINEILQSERNLSDSFTNLYDELKFSYVTC